MDHEIYREEWHANLTLRVYVWSTGVRWNSAGLISNGVGYTAEEQYFQPRERHFNSKQEAGESVWEVLESQIA